VLDEPSSEVSRAILHLAARFTAEREETPAGEVDVSAAQPDAGRRGRRRGLLGAFSKS
jgi:hypothetical protein